MVNLNWQKYPVYKSSGVEWLGDIPEHWEVKKIKRITQTHKQGYYTENPYIDEGVKLARITDIDDFGNVSFENMPFVEISEKNEKSFQLKKGDFLFARSGTIGRFGLVNALESSVFASYLIRFRFKNVEPEFLKFALSSSFFKESLISTLHGGANNNVHAENIKEQILVIPPTSEQQAVANFLDDKLAQIDEYIAKKQRMIELLKEQKTVIINQAVTKGINPDVPMKYSGVEWLGEIPEHWEAKKLKYLVEGKLKYGANEEAKSADKSQPRYIRITDFDGDGKLRDETFRSLEINLAKDYLLSEGDILFARSGATVGKTFQFKDYSGLACFAGYLIKAIPKESIILSDYLYLFTKSEVYDIWKTSIFIQATIQNIGADKYSCLSVSLPPISEQKEIVSFIEKKSEKIGRLLTVIEKEIKLIQEYRTTLISETVTGKIDVRKYHPPQ